MDQLSETYHASSPYAYVMNNPVNMFDPDGRLSEDWLMSLNNENMEKVKIAYYYIYYTLYKAAQKSPTIFPYRFVAVVSLNTIELFFIFSIFYYLSAQSNDFIDFNNITTKIILYLFFAIPLIANYFIFDYKDKYEQYIKKFEKLSNKADIKYRRVVWIFIVLIILNLVYSFYYMDQQARKNHIGRYSKEYIEKQKINDSINN